MGFKRLIRQNMGCICQGKLVSIFFWALTLNMAVVGCSRVSFKSSGPLESNPPPEIDDKGPAEDLNPDPPKDEDPTTPPEPPGPPQPPMPVQKMDEFTMQASSDQIDLFIVVDDSSSMEPEIRRLGARLDTLVKDLERSGISWQACFTTTHVTDNSIHRGLALNWRRTSTSHNQPQVLRRGEQNVDRIFRETLSGIPLGSGIDGKGDEQAIAALRFAIEDQRNRNCFRTNSDLHIIILSDEDERSCGGRCQSHSDEPSLQKWPLRRYTTDSFVRLSSFNREAELRSAFSRKWTEKKVMAHAIVIKENDKDCWKAQDDQHPAFYGIEFSKLARATGGVVGNICANDYASQLRQIAQRALEALKSVTLQCIPLTAPEVTLRPRPTEIAVSFQGDKVFFSPALAVGTKVTVKYTCP